MAVTDYNDGFNNGLAIGINIKGAEGTAGGSGAPVYIYKKILMKYFPPVIRNRTKSGATITKVI